jgi:antitoxin component HigA of HigAB toxin-antitoxin module
MTAAHTGKTAYKPAPVFAPLRTKHDFESAATELDYWADLDPKEGTAAYDRMELLTILIAAYEEDKLPAFKPASPQELVLFMAEQRAR